MRGRTTSSSVLTIKLYPSGCPSGSLQAAGGAAGPAGALGGARGWPGPARSALLPRAAAVPASARSTCPRPRPCPPRGAFGSTSLGSAAARGRSVSGSGRRGPAAPAPDGGAAAAGIWGAAGAALPGAQGVGPREAGCERRGRAGPTGAGGGPCAWGARR